MREIFNESDNCKIGEIQWHRAGRGELDKTGMRGEIQSYQFAQMFLHFALLMLIHPYAVCYKT